MGHRKPPRRLTPADLKGAALDYLDRFAATRARVRQVMLRKIRNSARTHGDDPALLVAGLDETIKWLEASGFLSDRAYAEAKAQTPKAIADLNAIIARAATLSTALSPFNLSLTVPPPVKAPETTPARRPSGGR